MIGAGVFALTGFAAGLAGPALLVAFALNAAVAFLTAMAYAELGASFPRSGGAYNWVSESLPRPLGFYTGWTNWFAQAVACALYAVTFGSFFTAFIGHPVVGAPRAREAGPELRVGHGREEGHGGVQGEGDQERRARQTRGEAGEGEHARPIIARMPMNVTLTRPMSRESSPSRGAPASGRSPASPPAASGLTIAATIGPSDACGQRDAGPSTWPRSRGVSRASRLSGVGGPHIGERTIRR